MDKRREVLYELQNCLEYNNCEDCPYYTFSNCQKKMYNQVEKEMFNSTEIDRYIKILTALLIKFDEELSAEYGSTITDKLIMIDKLYEAQQKIMPKPWYEYGFNARGGSYEGIC